MDRARHAGVAGPRLARGRDAGGSLRRTCALALAAAALACGRLGPDLDAVVAIEIILPDSGIVELGDTLRPSARPLDGRGDSAEALVFWASLDTLTVAVLDSTTGATLGRQAGTGRIQARVGNLRSNPVTLTVQPPLDSIYAGGAVRDTLTLPAPDSTSDSLRVLVAATPPLAQNVVRRPITFEAAVFPAGAGGVTLLPDDTVITDRTGLAAVRVRLLAGPAPDSVVVTARAARFDGTPVARSPLTFVVEFGP